MSRSVAAAVMVAAAAAACVPAPDEPPVTSAASTTVPVTSTTAAVAPSTATTVATSTTTTVPATWWRPTADRPLTFHWMLDQPVNLNNPWHLGLRDINGNPLPQPDVIDIDGEFNTAATVAELKRRGYRVICYFDAGVYEDYRSDAWRFPPEVIGKPDHGWDGSWWLDVRRVDVLEPIMRDRIRMCRDKGFDAIEPDEIDGWENDTGFPISYNDQLRYNRALARWAHEAGMSIGLKGDLVQARDLVNDFDWTLNEECFEYDECAAVWDPRDGRTYPGLQVFTQQNKAVWVAEYRSWSASQWSGICATSAAQRWNTTRFRLGLPGSGGRLPCQNRW